MGIYKLDSNLEGSSKVTNYLKSASKSVADDIYELKLILSESAKQDIIYNSKTDEDIRILCDKYIFVFLKHSKISLSFSIP